MNWEQKRKLMHYGTAVIPIIYFFTTKKEFLTIIGTALVALLLFDLARISNKRFSGFIEKLLPGFVKESEKQSLLGASWLFLGAFATAFLFPQTITIIALLYSSLGDASAALFGKAYGKHKLIGRRTIEGSLAFLGTCIIIAFLVQEFIGINTAARGAVAATLAELMPFVDDNFSVPLIAAAVMVI